MDDHDEMLRVENARKFSQRRVHGHFLTFAVSHLRNGKNRMMISQPGNKGRRVIQTRNKQVRLGCCCIPGQQSCVEGFNREEVQEGGEGEAAPATVQTRRKEVILES